jgi:putative phosphoesterase
VRVAALYDIHANLPALEAVLRHVRETSVDRIVVGGDVLPGPMPVETMASLASLDVPVEYIQGNGDREVVACRKGQRNKALPEQAQQAIEWAARELSDEHQKVLESWPATLRQDIPGAGSVLFCHATPRSDTDNFTRLTPEEELEPIFRNCGADIVICGHTHMQFDRRIGAVRVLNAGSVGMPFGETGAYWLLLGPTGPQLQRTSYDLAAAAARVRTAEYPQADQFSEFNVLHPPSEETILAAFSGVRQQ